MTAQLMAMTKYKASARLLNLAEPLLLFIAQLEFHNPPLAMGATHRALCLELKLFIQAVNHSGFDSMSAKAASYCLATAIDEAIMRRNQFNNHDWSAKSLLSVFHNETWGGERFFKILEYYSAETPTSEVVELIYTLLSLGYLGRYHLHPKRSVESLRKQLYCGHLVNRSTQVTARPSNSSSSHNAYQSKLVVSCLVGMGLILMVFACSYQLKLQPKLTRFQQLLSTIQFSRPIAASLGVS